MRGTDAREQHFHIQHDTDGIGIIVLQRHRRDSRAQAMGLSLGCNERRNGSRYNSEY
jgi:hypothetical protein